MKRLIITFVLALAALLVISVYPVFGADEAGVSVTVTAKNISISVDLGSYNYGPLALSDTTETTSTFTVTNNGNVDELFFVKGADTEDWTLSEPPAVGAYAYKHEWSENGGVSYTGLSKSNQAMNGGNPIAANVGSLSNVKFKISMPTSSNSFADQNTSVTFLATE